MKSGTSSNHHDPVPDPIYNVIVNCTHNIILSCIPKIEDISLSTTDDAMCSPIQSYIKMGIDAFLNLIIAREAPM